MDSNEESLAGAEQSRASIHTSTCYGYVSPSMNSVSISNYVIGAISEIAMVCGQRM